MSGYPYTTSAPMPRAMTGRRTGERRPSGPAGPLSLAVLCVVAMALVWVVAELVPAVQLKDSILLSHFVELDHGTVHAIAWRLPHLLSPGLFVLWSVALVLIAIARDRPRVALAVALILGLAPLTAEILKPLLAHPHVRVGYTHIGAASFPSGHSTAATILVMSAVLVAPRRLKLLVAVIGTAFVLAVSAALLIRAWHMPSDVLGGYLTALLWASLAVAGLRAADRRWPRKTPAGP
jgi:membrane-associated phospholipid phosphatase